MNAIDKAELANEYGLDYIEKKDLKEKLVKIFTN